MSKLRKWTTKEIQLLQERIAAGRSPGVIAKELKRTEAAILAQMARLKTRKNRGGSPSLK